MVYDGIVDLIAGISLARVWVRDLLPAMLGLCFSPALFVTNFWGGVLFSPARSHYEVLEKVKLLF